MPGEAARPTERVLDGRFRAIRLLKSGVGVETWLGTDSATGAEVVIKTVQAAAVPAAALMRLEHEAAVLGRIRRPAYAPLVAFGREAELLYLVARFVPGVTLADHLHRRSLPAREAITVAVSVLAGLQEAHDLGVIHRDVKPANIVVDDGEPLKRATLIDFGLARSSRLDPSLRELPVGTARYCSPEQAGLLDHDVDERSDLYSLGAVLFECLAGRPPFEGSSVGTVLRLHLTAAPPELSSVGVTVPRALEDVVQRLLMKDPRDRYQSAFAVAADLEEIAAALDRGIDDPAIVVGLHDRRGTLTEPTFVGRRREAEILRRGLERARAGAGSLSLLESPSGGGKSRLLDELGQAAAHEDAVVVRGQALHEAAQRPFQLFAGVAAGVVQLAHDNPQAIRAVRARLGDDRQAVCDALPELTAALGPRGRATLGPEAHGERRSVRALASLLDALGSPDHPALVLLDDAQWADESTLKALRHWASNAPAGRHTSIVVAFRSEEVGAGHPLRDLDRSELVGLPPLGSEDVRGLAESMAGSLPQEALDVVEQLADGSPFMASAVVRGLVESSALVHGRDGWRIEAEAMAKAQSSRQAAVFLTHRLRLLPPSALRLLCVGAVLGKDFDLGLAADLAGQPSTEAVASVNLARHRQIIWERDGGTRCAFVHDKLRETLLAMLPAEERSLLHRRAADRLERTSPDRVFELAYHFDAAGLPERALPFALSAAHRARMQHSLEIAEQQFAIAQRGAAKEEADVRRGIAEGLADVLMLRGRYDEAALEFERARSLVHDDLARAEIDAKLSELAFKRGDLSTSAEKAETALRHLGRNVPRSQASFAVRTLWEILVQVAHTLFRRTRARRSLEGASADRLAMRLYSRLAHVYWFQLGSVPTLWAHLREMNLAERYPASPELAQAYSEHAPAMMLVPWFKRAATYAERSLAIRRDLGDVWGQGQSLNFYGVVLYIGSRYAEAVERSQEACRLLELTGDRWELNIARMHVAFSLYRLGRLREAVEEARRVHRDGLEIGDPQASGIGLEIIAKATGGRVGRQSMRTELRRPTRDVQLQAEIQQAEGVRLLGEGAADAAVELLEETRRLVKRSGVRQEYVAPVWAWLATALRQQAEEVPVWARRRRRIVLRRAGATARAAIWIARRYRNNLPHALRERGIVHAMAGHPRRARRCLERSLAVAERQGARYEHARSLAFMARIGLDHGWAGSEEDLALAEAALARMEAGIAPDRTRMEGPEDEATLSLVDRFSGVLDSGRRIAAALSRQGIHDAVREAGRELLRGEDCVLLKVSAGADGELDLAAVSGEFQMPFSRRLAAEAVATGRPALFQKDSPEDTTESMELSGARSALCAPIAVRHRIELLLYVSHRKVTGLFGPDEERLAEFITALAGAALENAEGFAEIQDLTRTLETRVEQRTEALQRANRALDQSLKRLTQAYQREREVVRKLQELDELKSDFLSTVSHELRTPLTAIGGFAQTLIGRWDEVGDSARQDFIQRIANNAGELNSLIGELLDFSRLERGHLTVVPKPCDVASGVQRAVDKMSTVLGNHQVDIRVPLGLSMWADENACDRVVENLLTNAAKFAPAGTRITIGAQAQGDEVILSVSDEGPGIPRGERDRIFERFYRIDRGDHARAGGTGIGLAIVREFVVAQGGRVWVDSEPGRGSTFNVALRRAPGATPPAVSEVDFTIS